MDVNYEERIFEKKYRLTKSSLKSAKKAIEEVEYALTDADKISALKELLSIYEKGALAIRYELQSLDISNGTFFDEKEPECSKEIPVEILETEDALIVKTPITVKRRSSDYTKSATEIYYLAQYVHAAFKKWQRDNDMDDLYLFRKFDDDKFDLAFIIKRKATSFNQKLHCDNDNIENNTILNEICSALAIGDSCMYVDHLYSCFRITNSEDDVGTEFIITARKNISKYSEKTL